MIARSIAATVILFICAYGQQVYQGSGVSDLCLGCMCEAFSGCNVSRGCGGGVCGPFGISWGYWADSGKPVLQLDNPQSNGAYERCVTDPACASRSVVAYMDKFRRDCNGDGRIDCTDFVLIHGLGPANCYSVNQLENLVYFDNCKRQVATLGLATDFS